MNFLTYFEMTAPEESLVSGHWWQSGRSDSAGGAVIQIWTHCCWPPSPTEQSNALLLEEGDCDCKILRLLFWFINGFLI